MTTPRFDRDSGQDGAVHLEARLARKFYLMGGVSRYPVATIRRRARAQRQVGVVVTVAGVHVNALRSRHAEPQQDAQNGRRMWDLRVE